MTLISWKCRKCERVSKSSTKAKYWAMSTFQKSFFLFRSFLSKLHVLQQLLTLNIGNTSVMQIITHLVYHERTKNILKLIVALFKKNLTQKHHFYKQAFRCITDRFLPRVYDPYQFHFSQIDIMWTSSINLSGSVKDGIVAYNICAKEATS